MNRITRRNVLILRISIFALGAILANEIHAKQVKDHAAANVEAKNMPEEVKDGIRPSYSLCLNASDGVTSKIQACATVEYAYQDARLNSVYKTLLQRLDKDKQVKLRAEQRAWIAYRDTHCESFPDDGEAQMLMAQDCEVREAAKQAEYLQFRLVWAPEK